MKSATLLKLHDIQVLIVDDNNSDRLVLRKALKTIGFRQIQEAEDGSLAQYKIDNAYEVGDPFQLVFIDLRMPRKNGLGLLENLRARRQTSEIYIIMVTGESDLDNVETALRKGVDDFLVKPLSLASLRPKVDRFLDKELAS